MVQVIVRMSMRTVLQNAGTQAQAIPFTPSGVTLRRTCLHQGPYQAQKPVQGHAGQAQRQEAAQAHRALIARQGEAAVIGTPATNKRWKAVSRDSA